MIKKRVWVLFLCVFLISAIILCSSFALAINDTDNANANLEGFDKAYDCLNKLVDDRGVTSLSHEELSFALLALAYNSNKHSAIKSELLKAGKNEECWPKENCNIKDTSIALLALDYINSNTKDIESWLLNKTKPADNLVWFLEIDSNKATKCTVKYKDISKEVTISEEGKITGNAGSCLRVSYNGFWLEIDPTCYSTEFEVSCTEDFVTTLVFKKKSGSTVHISSLTSTGLPGGSTFEKVNSLCFKQGSTCDYEGTLWATLALKKAGEDVNDYLPYLIALYSDAANTKYLPSSFLYIITGYEEYLNELVSEQKTQGYWQTQDSSRRYYDTALALLALKGYSTDQEDLALNYLLDGIKPEASSGCWGNSIRDTSFILYAVSPKTPSSVVDSKSNCADFGYFCLSSEEQCKEVGNVLSNYYCSGLRICCDKEVTVEPPINPSGVTACEQAGYDCKSFCDTDTEVEKTYSCSDYDKCCASKPQTEKKFSWIWLLIILIILLVLAILYRNQLKVWLFKKGSNFRNSPAPVQGRPFFPQSPQAPGMRPTGPRFFSRPQMPMRRPFPQQQKPFPKQKELDDTLKKLRDMGR